MEDWTFNSSRKRLAALRTAMFAISKCPLFWRNTCEALDFAQCSAHQRKEHKVEQTLTRLQKLLELAPHVNESTPEIVEVRVGQSAWERNLSRAT